MNRSLRNRHGERGQSIVLLAVTSLLLAATLLTTFSIGKAIHERIAVQQAADASAYSMAVEEARAFNYYAYANRASLSHYLAIMAIYSHMSYVLAWDAYLKNSLDVWCNDFLGIQNQVLLTAINCWSLDFDCPFGTYCLSITSECECLDEEYNTVGNTCSNVQSGDYQTVNSQLSSIMSGLHTQAQTELANIAGPSGSVTAGEKAVDKAVYDAISQPTFTDAIAKKFDPNFTSQMPAALATLNKNGITGSGSKTAAGYCDATAGFSCPGANVFRTQFTAANAGRWQPPSGTLSGDFTRNRGVNTLSAPTGSTIAMQLINDFDSNEPTAHLTDASGTGMARLTDQSSATGDPSADLHVSGETNSSGYRATAHDHGTVKATDVLISACPGAWPEPPAYWFENEFKVYAYSTPTGNPSSTHSAYNAGQGETDDQLDLGGCVGNDCGILEPQINFRIATSNQSQVLFNQPRTFAVIEEKFDKSTWGPFGIKLDNAIKMFDPQKSSYDNIVNDSTVQGRESILGVSSGLAYYHRPGMWREPPNFYNPYWRAKLNSFNATTDELSQVVKAAGYTGVNSGTNFLTSLPATQ